jgi:hypothetical protein
MLVVISNVVKVESVPLNFGNFHHPPTSLPQRCCETGPGKSRQDTPVSSPSAAEMFRVRHVAGAQLTVELL